MSQVDPTVDAHWGRHTKEYELDIGQGICCSVCVLEAEMPGIDAGSDEFDESRLDDIHMPSAQSLQFRFVDLKARDNMT
ncbi:hypothetical protein A5698_26620 [Mycobacterium sp. E136]|nr:hypothetical protein A5698_26620 [Mycobacterium sp. E136]